MKQFIYLAMCIFFVLSTVFLYVAALDTAFALYSHQYQTELLGLRAEMPLLTITVFAFILSVLSLYGYYMLYTGQWDSLEDIERELDSYERSSI